MTGTAETPAHRYTAALAQQIELAWQQRWADEGTFWAPNPTGPLSEGFAEHGVLPDGSPRPHYYVNDMFPYPSGEGLHVGHPLGYVGTDIYSRYLRMRGYNVLHTMGFDAFGLPAEQYAVQTGQHPRLTTERNIVAIRQQLRRMGMDHDTRRSISTIDPEYYRWTQWIFAQVFSSFYDTELDRARPISELITELEAGSREPQPDTLPDEVGPGTTWSELDESQRRSVVDAHRLAYVSEAPVNWCPGLGTVLSNEEVTADGRSERGNFPVFRRPLRQWMMRITAYADRLLADLDRLDWPESIKQQQRNWIGRSTGATITFPSTTTSNGADGAGGADGADQGDGIGGADQGDGIGGADQGDGIGVDVFTTRPDTVFGATYLVLAPEHDLVDQLVGASWPTGTPASWRGDDAPDPAAAVALYQRQASRRSELERQSDQRTKTGVFLGSHATNPVTGAQIPIFIADYVLTGYGTGAIMAVPGQDERDWAFAETYDLPIVRTVQPPADFDGQAYTGAGPAIHSSVPGLSLDGLSIPDAKATMISWLVEQGAGAARTTYRLRDWLFSRQRYWGEPFPIVYPVDGPDAGRPVVIPDRMLPVELPDVDDYSPRTFPDDDVTSQPEAPLGRASEWVEVTLDLGDGPRRYRRDTNTMPNWAGSCWYELRYLDPDNTEVLVDPEIEAYWMGPSEAGATGGVDLYVGGAEHAVLHLLYARFWHKVLYDLGHVSSGEPFHRLINQGMLQAPAFTDARGMYVQASEVVETADGFSHAGQPVRREFGKIGKSLKNMITPDDIFTEYGVDTFRLYEMFTGPLDQSRPWDSKAVVGMQRLLQRIWRLVVDEETGALRTGGDGPDGSGAAADDASLAVLHGAIAGVRDGMDTLRFNVAIARATELVNHLTQTYAGRSVPRDLVEPLVLLVAPLAPHLAEELWSRLGHPGSLAREPYPEADPARLVRDEVNVVVQINGKVRSTVTVASGADAELLETAARADRKIIAQLDGRTVRKVIVVPGRLVNFVVS